MADERDKDLPPDASGMGADPDHRLGAAGGESDLRPVSHDPATPAAPGGPTADDVIREPQTGDDLAAQDRARAAVSRDGGQVASDEAEIKGAATMPTTDASAAAQAALQADAARADAASGSAPEDASAGPGREASSSDHIGAGFAAGPLGTSPRLALLTTALPFGWKAMLGFGIFTLLGGVLAILAPFVASLTVVGLAAAVFILLGAAQLWAAFKGDPKVAEHRALNGILGALMVVFGVWLFAQPLEGLLTLTIFVAAFFVVEGGLQIWLATRMRGREGWGWLAAGGAVSVLLGLMVLFALPGAAIWVLGLLLGIDLVSTGVAMVALSFAEKRATGDGSDHSGTAGGGV